MNDVEGSQFIEWNYPEIYDRKKQDWLVINLSHTRASDGIRLKYDSERAGWIIEQPSDPSWKPGEELDCHWQEVAFVESWSRYNDAKESR